VRRGGNRAAISGWHADGVEDIWVAMPASQVQVGDRVRFAPGNELEVSAIEPNFFGGPLVAFIEDTPQRWFKQPVPEEREVEVRRPG
jgi:hypothetical protein